MVINTTTDALVLPAINVYTADSLTIALDKVPRIHGYATKKETNLGSKIVHEGIRARSFQG